LASINCLIFVFNVLGILNYFFKIFISRVKFENKKLKNKIAELENKPIEEKETNDGNEEIETLN